MDSIIQFKDVAVRFGNRKLLDGLTLPLELSRGGKSRAIAVVGPSGSGKSTLLDLIMRIRLPNAGQVELPKGIKLGYIPQSPVLFDALSVTDNATLLRDQATSTQAFTAQYNALSELLHAHRLLDGRALSALSGGERQRVMLLRALSVHPSLLICDEATASLDAGLIAEFMSYLRRIKQELNTAVLFVAHTWREIAYLADEILYLAPAVGSATVQIAKMETDEFRRAPPTLHAFLTVHWPKCTFLTAQRTEAGAYIGVGVPSAATPAAGTCSVAVPAAHDCDSAVYDEAGRFVTHPERLAKLA